MIFNRTFNTKLKNLVVIVTQGVKNQKRKEQGTDRSQRVGQNFRTTEEVIPRKGEEEDHLTSQKLLTTRNIQKEKAKRERNGDTVR